MKETESLSKAIEDMKNHQVKILEPKNTVSEIKNSKDGLHRRMEGMRKIISDTQFEQQTENRLRKKGAKPQGFVRVKQKI